MRTPLILVSLLLLGLSTLSLRYLGEPPRTAGGSSYSLAAATDTSRNTAGFPPKISF